MQVSSGGLIVDDDITLRTCDGKAMTHFHIFQLNLIYVFVNLKL